MPIAVVTSCSAAGWLQYGRHFFDTFDRFWPLDVDLYIASEDVLPLPRGNRHQVTFIDLNSNLEVVEFLKRCASNPRANGSSSGRVVTMQDKRYGYNFRMDAFRFSKKVFALKMAADRVLRGRLIWLDADVVTTALVPWGFLTELPPASQALAYLDRKPYHSECGFVGYNLDHPITHAFINKFAGTYLSDAVFELKEWNDCFVFDHLRKTMGVSSYAIPHKSVSHPFVHSVLGQYMDHLKGRRKDRGMSHDHPKYRAKK